VMVTGFRSELLKLAKLAGGEQATPSSNDHLSVKLDALRAKLDRSRGSTTAKKQAKPSLDEVIAKRSEKRKSSSARGSADTIDTDRAGKKPKPATVTIGSGSEAEADDDDGDNDTKSVVRLLSKLVKRGRSSRSTGDDGSSSSGEHEGGRLDADRRVDIIRVAKRHPGKLTNIMLKNMSSLIGERLPPEGEGPEEARPVVTAYLHGVLHISCPREKMGLRNSREFATIALAMDHIVRGQVSAGLDVLTQRWKALERTLVDGHWSMARWHELIPTTEAPLLSRGENHAALRLEKSERSINLKKG
jgi:hypothetical protein